MNLFVTPVSSPALIGLSFVYGVCAAVTTFDTRIIQAKKSGFLSMDEAIVPEWTGLFGILLWLTWLSIFLLNWKYALFLFVLKFILKTLPVLENIGAILLLPIVGRKTAASVNIIAQTQKKDRKEYEKILAQAKSKRDSKVIEAIEDEDTAKDGVNS